MAVALTGLALCEHWTPGVGVCEEACPPQTPRITPGSPNTGD